MADVANEANTADVAYNNLDNFEEANEVHWVDETSLVNDADVANMADSFVEAKEEDNKDSIALSDSKFNCCFMITSANVIAVAKIPVVESACEIQSTYATTNRTVDADVQSKDVFDLPLKGKAFFDLLAIDLIFNIAAVSTFTNQQESQL